MTTTLKQTKRVNRQDLTLRNLRAMKKRIEVLEKRLTKLEKIHGKN